MNTDFDKAPHYVHNLLVWRRFLIYLILNSALVGSQAAQKLNCRNDLIQISGLSFCYIFAYLICLKIPQHE